jgi:hypothetical protein
MTDASRSVVDTFLAASPNTQALMRACAVLQPGLGGPDQSSNIRHLLRDLEAQGLATYSEARGWRLTETGRELSQTYLAVGRAARKLPELAAFLRGEGGQS